MFRRLQIVLGFAAWFLATGSQWDFTQVIAWGRMFSDYSQEMTWSAAAKKTFSGEMCSICRFAANGREAQEQGDARFPSAKAPGKLIEFCPVATVARVWSPRRSEIGGVLSPVHPASRERAAPPRPPPRTLA